MERAWDATNSARTKRNGHVCDGRRRAKEAVVERATIRAAAQRGNETGAVWAGGMVRRKDEWRSPRYERPCKQRRNETGAVWAGGMVRRKDEWEEPEIRATAQATKE